METHTGLTVSKSGVLLRDGKPWRGIGVNVAQILDEDDVEAAFVSLSKHKIPFVRVFGCEYAPWEVKKYHEYKGSYFARYDRLVRIAETYKVGLIPSLFWNPATVPALVGERMAQWGDPTSKTRQYMHQYLRDFVGRYKKSPAIWGWEFGNEYNLVSDLPEENWWRPDFRAEALKGKAIEAADQLTFETLCAVCQDFAAEVRREDPYRIISTGCSIPRKAAWHLWKEKSWTDDSPRQFEMMLNGPLSTSSCVISIHAYDEDVARIPQAMLSARRLGRPLFLGEFGVEGVSEKTKRAFQQVLGLIIREKVPLAALWVFHRASDEGTWNVTDSNARSYQLKAIAESNQRIRNELKLQWPGEW